MTISSKCPQCGIIQKSGKLSCCGRGGSWFGNCESARNANFGNTWHEGIWACRARQFQAAVGQQERPPDASSEDSKALIAAAQIFDPTPANTVTLTLVTTQITMNASMPIITPARTSTACDTGECASQAMNTTTMYTSVKILPPQLTIPIVNTTITQPAYGSIASPANIALDMSMQSASTDGSLTTPFQSFVSASITARAFEEFLHVVLHISMMLINIC